MVPGPFRVGHASRVLRLLPFTTNSPSVFGTMQHALDVHDILLAIFSNLEKQIGDCSRLGRVNKRLFATSLAFVWRTASLFDLLHLFGYDIESSEFIEEVRFCPPPPAGQMQRG